MKFMRDIGELGTYKQASMHTFGNAEYSPCHLRLDTKRIFTHDDVEETLSKT